MKIRIKGIYDEYGMTPGAYSILLMSIIIAVSSIGVSVTYNICMKQHQLDTHYLNRLNQIEDAIIEHNKQWEQMPRSRWIEVGDSLQRQKRLTRDSLYLQINTEQPKH